MDEQQQTGHELPAWFHRAQDGMGLTALVMAEAYLLGFLMSSGWVANIQDPSSWGWFQGAGVLLFFGAGAMSAGVSIVSANRAAMYFVQKKWGMAWFNTLGAFIFVAVEVWASLSERSANIHPTPADNAVLQVFFNVTNAPVSPTIVMIALLLPFASLYYGFSRQKPQKAEIEDAETLRKRLENEQIKALYAGKIGAVKAQARRKVAAAWAGIATQDDIEEAAPDDDAIEETAEETSEKPIIRTAGLPPGMIDKDGLQAWAKKELGRDISDTEATEILKGAKGSQRHLTAQGQPYIASAASAKSLAKRRYPAQVIRLVSDRKGSQKPTAFAPQIRHETDDGVEANG